ncbi:hypothetical protein RB195_022358 [Necator americanus]|uniref:Mariner Mos1 transposase n=1 Tax=Necator americanus TaxID=51031 RepID=A0ABR1EF88_NECAM
MEPLLDQDSCQTQEKLAETLELTQQAISSLLKAIGMVQKQESWIPSELKPREMNRGPKVNPRRQSKAQISRGQPSHALTSKTKPNFHGKKLMLWIWWDQLEVICYELLQPNETISGERWQQQFVQLSRALKLKRLQYARRHDKVILQHDSTRQCCKDHQGDFEGATMGSSIPPAVFIRHCSFRLQLVPVDNSRLGQAALHYFRGSQKLGLFLDRFKRRGISPTRNPYAP